MYDMLTGAPPFTAENRKKTIEKILKVVLSHLRMNLLIDTPFNHYVMLSFRVNWTCRPTSPLMPETSSSKHFSPHCNPIPISPSVSPHLFDFQEAAEEANIPTAWQWPCRCRPHQNPPLLQGNLVFNKEQIEELFIHINDPILIAHKLGGCDSAETGTTIQTGSCFRWRCQVGFKTPQLSIQMFNFSQFDANFTKQTPVDSPCGASLSESVNLVFQVIPLEDRMSPYLMVFSFSRCQIVCRRFNLAAFQGFTYVAPSVLDSMSDMQRSSEFRPRSVRRPRVGSLVRGGSGSLQMAPGQVDTDRPHPYQNELADTGHLWWFKYTRYSFMVTTWQGGAARGVVGAGQGGVTVQGGLGIPSSQGFTTIHPVIESMETGEVLIFSLKPHLSPSTLRHSSLVNINSWNTFLIFFSSGRANGPIEKWGRSKRKIHSGELSGGSWN